MPGAFVGEAEGVVDRAGCGDDQNIFGRKMFADAAGLGFAGLGFEGEGAGGGQLRDEIVVADVEGKNLSADGGGGFKFVNDLQAIGGADDAIRAFTSPRCGLA